MVKSQKEIRDDFIKIRVNKMEKVKINELAKACNQKPSEYARARLLGYQADNTKKEKLILNAQLSSSLNKIARQVVNFPNKVDSLLLLQALNTIEESLHFTADFTAEATKESRQNSKE